MVNDQLIMQAVSKILQRSERQADLQKLLGTFVDVGILPQLINRNNQILYGRRGTGKTHVLRVLASKLEESPRNAVAYIDARTLGSTAQFSDTQVPIRQRCLALFRDILTAVHTALLEQIIEHPSERAEEALALSDQLLSSILDPVQTYRAESLTTSLTAAKTDGSSTGIELVPSSLGARFSLQAEQRQEKQTSSSFAVETDDKVVFPTLHSLLSQILELSRLDLYVLLDEWSSIPQDIQPYLAEFLKRGVLPVSSCVLKIASLEYRSHFNTHRNGGEFLGFELGADISTAQDLDDYYVFDRNPEQVTTVYADMLLRHLAIELPENYLSNSYRIATGDQLASKLFTERATFNELARASEGVVRDLINIFTLAFFHAHRRGRTSVDRRAVLEASRQWFEQDKAQHLDDKMHVVLRRIVDQVIGERKARSFLLPRELEKHPMIQRLFDQRLLHQMQRGYADKDNPGVRYNIYSLDYGTYVDLMGTIKQPDVDLHEVLDSETGTDLVVPFDDKRSIRRVILTQEVLD